MNEREKQEGLEMIRAQFAVLDELLRALERGGEGEFLMHGLPRNDVAAMREVARRLHDGSYKLVFR